MIEAPSDPWVAGQLALALLSVDPVGLKGLHLRARAGDVRARFLGSLPQELSSLQRIAPSIDDVQLFGGIDIAETLSNGRVALKQGLIFNKRGLLLGMAERCPVGLAARLSQALDNGFASPVILLDEGASADEGAPPRLTDRLAFSVDLDGLRAADLSVLALSRDNLERARDTLSEIPIDAEAIDAMTVAGLRFGIDSLRAPLLALNAARAHAALSRHKSIETSDLQVAAQLVLAPRATQIPEDLQDEAQDSATETPPEPNSANDQTQVSAPEDMLIDAIKAALPPDILSNLTNLRNQNASGSGAGAKKQGNRRGRPLPSRHGRLSSDKRIDLVATLRAAAPWQKLRARTGRLAIRGSDIRLRRFEESSDRLIIFAVDGSGSSAMARMAEAKGAVELLLAEAYARRDHVALVAFGGDEAELILPPTRSLVQTKRRLAGLPGGGGTPLASGLRLSFEIARQAQSQGYSPALALLTDGRANVALPGRTGRKAAREDAQSMARLWSSSDLASVTIDTAQRPQHDLRELAGILGGSYIPLPRADARGLSRAIGAALVE